MIVVSGVPGSRTSLTMRLLGALGLTVLHQPDGEQSNPDGDYEGPWTHEGIDTAEHPAEAAAKVMPIPMLRSTLGPADRIIVPFRCPADVARSRPAVTGFNYWRLYRLLLEFLPTQGVPVLYLDTDALCERPDVGVELIRSFIGSAVDPSQAISIVRPQPYPQIGDEDEETAATHLWATLRSLA